MTTTVPNLTDIGEAVTFIEAAKTWLDEGPDAVAAGFDPEASAVMMLDRALEFLRGEV